MVASFWITIWRKSAVFHVLAGTELSVSYLKIMCPWGYLELQRWLQRPMLKVYTVANVTAQPLAIRVDNQGGRWISMHEVILHSLVRVGRLMMVPQVKLTAVSGPLCPMRCHQLSHCQSVVFMPASHYQLATQSFSFSRSHHLTSPVTVSNYSTPYCVALLCNNRQPRLVGSDRATHWGCYYILLPSQTEGNEKDKTEVYY